MFKLFLVLWDSVAYLNGKYYFWKTSIQCSSVVIDKNGVEKAKVQVLKVHPSSSAPTDLKILLGDVNLRKKFIEYFSYISEQIILKRWACLRYDLINKL